MPTEKQGQEVCFSDRWRTFALLVKVGRLRLICFGIFRSDSQRFGTLLHAVGIPTPSTSSGQALAKTAQEWASLFNGDAKAGQPPSPPEFVRICPVTLKPASSTLSASFPLPRA